MTAYSTQSIVFIDSRVPDLQGLLAGLQPGEQAFVIDPSSDGIEQVADILAANNLTGLSSISIVSHGESGAIEFGSSFITDQNLSAHSAALAEIGAALGSDGAIKLYGCDVGQGVGGQQFINDFSALAGGAPVEASTQLVGSASLGGTWTLDAASGGTTPTNDANAPFTSAALDGFQSVLAPSAQTEVWFVTAGAGGNSNSIDFADNTGSNAATNAHTLYQGNTHLTRPTDIALDTQDNLYFMVDSDANGHNVIEKAQLSQAVGSSGTASPTFTTLYSDPGAFGNISAIALDVPDQIVYFIQNNPDGFTSSFDEIKFDGTGLTTLATVSGVFFSDMTLDLTTGNAYITAISESVGFGGTTVNANLIYDASGITPTATSVTMSTLPVSPDDPGLGGDNFPASLGVLTGIAVDKVNHVLYFTTDPTTTTTHGGIYSYNLTSNPTGTFGTVWQQPAPVSLSSTAGTPFGLLNYIEVDPTTNTYYVGDFGEFASVGVSDNSIYVGALTGSTLARTPSHFISVNGSPSAAQPQGIALDNAPTLALTVATPTWTEDGANASLVSSATAIDSDNTKLLSATVSITGGFRSGDVLTDSTGGTSITSSYNSSTGVLTLSGADTLSDYQSVLASVQYHGGENPTDFSRTDSSRTVTWTVNDGLLTSAPQTSSVSVAFVNDPPTLSGLTTASWTEEGAAATLSPGAAVTDPDDLNLSGATVQITGGTFVGDADVLAADTTGTNITASYNAATETLTLTGTDSLAHYQSVLDKITFSAGENPTNFGANPTRTVTWTLTDPSGTANGGLDSSTTTSTVNVLQVNDPPILSNVAASAQYTEEGGAVTLSSGTSVSDADDQNLSSATVKITGGTFAGDADVLAANVASTNITASYNAATETLTLTGLDTLAHYQSVLDSVTFVAGENPTDFGSNPTRTITWQAKDPSGTANGGSDTSTLSTTTVTITNVNDAPTLSNVAASAQYTEEGGAVTLSNATTVTDPDNLNLANATVQITGGTFPGDADVLAASTTGTNITASYNAATETLTLTGSDSLANYQAVLDSVTFIAGENPNDFGSNPTRTVTWVVNDGSGSFNLSNVATTTINITNVNDAPTLSNVAANAQYTEEGGAVTLSNAITVTDPDNLNLANATVQITGGTFPGDADVLAATVAGTNITANYNSSTETLTLTGSDTLANYQSVLDSVTFIAGENPNDFGSNPTRTVTWVVNDGSGSFNLSNVATTTIAITNVNDAPTLSNVAASANFTQGGGAVTLSSAASASDPDNLNLVGATLAITAGAFAGDGDVLAANTTGTNITASYNAVTETLTLTGSDTLAHYNQVLDSVTFNSTSANPTNFGANPTRTVTWVVNDGSGSFNLSTARTETINVTNVNDAPTLTGVSASASYTEQSAPTTLSGNVTVSDPDDSMLVGATVKITGGTFAGDADVLATSTTGTSITASYDSSTETLTLTGTDTLADYQSVLDKVTFSEAGDNPTNYGSNPTRTVTWVLNDGHASNNLSTAQTETVNVIGVNDPPTLANVAATVGFLPHHTITISPSIAVSDPDNLTLSNATVKITAGSFAGDGDVLAANVSGTSITASYNAATETLTLSGVDSLAHYQSVLDSVTFSSGGNPSNGNSNRTRTVTWTINDGSGSNNTSTATTTISIGGGLPRNDFNGDGNSDLLFQNSGVPHPDVMVEVLNGSSVASSGTITTPSGWTVEAMGDFNHDSKTDIVLQNSNGTPQIWLMNGTSVTSTVTLSNPGSSWHVIASDDFNGDGNADILWQNTNGTPMIWQMNGTSVVSTATLTNPGVSWSVIGAGDFNGDGNADILFQKDDNTPMIWEMNGSSVIASATLPNPGQFMHAIGTGDFNGDGNADILFQNKDGTPLIWEMNGTSILASATLSNPGKSWDAIGTEDFNADGKADILFQNGDGTPLVWQMNGTSVASTFTTANPGSQWVLQDDGPIPASQMGSNGNSGGGSMHQSAPDTVAGAGSVQANNQQHLVFGT